MNRRRREQVGGKEKEAVRQNESGSRGNEGDRRENKDEGNKNVEKRKEGEEVEERNGENRMGNERERDTLVYENKRGTAREWR